MQAPSVRRALYVLYARLLAGPPDAALYRRLRTEGMTDLARIHGVDLFSDLSAPDDEEASARELAADHEHWAPEVSLLAGDYGTGAEDPAAALSAFMREHQLRLDEAVELRADHLAVVLGLMGELAVQTEEEETTESRHRARAFFQRHVEPWAQKALAELSAHSDRRFYRGLASLVSSFLANERRHFGAA